MRLSRTAPLAVSAAFFLLAGVGHAEEAAPDDDLKAAAAFVFQALPGQCDERDDSDASGFVEDDQSYKMSWKSGYDESGDEQKAVLFRIFCYAGAYNIASVFAIRPADGDFALVAFAEPTFKVDYVEGDETYTKLKADPAATGFGTTYLLVNADFTPENNTISSFSKWRGIGDAWTQGEWQLRDGQFVLTGFSIDPIYEGNLDNPSNEEIDKHFQLYPETK
ncbi:DUF1176 domain-containing protein [Rhizobium sp. PAMB 3182]